MDPGCWTPPGGCQLFVGQQFQATAFSMLAPRYLAEDVFCCAVRGPMRTVGPEHAEEGVDGTIQALDYAVWSSIVRGTAVS